MAAWARWQWHRLLLENTWHVILSKDSLLNGLHLCRIFDWEFLVNTIGRGDSIILFQDYFFFCAICHLWKCAPARLVLRQSGNAARSRHFKRWPLPWRTSWIGFWKSLIQPQRSRRVFLGNYSVREVSLVSFVCYFHVICSIGVGSWPGFDRVCGCWFFFGRQCCRCDGVGWRRFF